MSYANSNTEALMGIFFNKVMYCILIFTPLVRFSAFDDIQGMGLFPF